jgi:hypothetical protein
MMMLFVDLSDDCIVDEFGVLPAKFGGQLVHNGEKLWRAVFDVADESVYGGSCHGYTRDGYIWQS